MGDVDILNISDYPVKSPKNNKWPQQQILQDVENNSKVLTLINMEEINEDLIKKVFEERYKINISVLFIRQVLGVGIENKSIVKKYGKYIIYRIY